jgi:hydrogenase maturation protease
MSHEPHAAPVLVLGWGSSLRRDDAAGATAAEAVAALHDPRIDARSLHQLFPELAEPLAAASVAIFLDARVAGPGETITVAPLEGDPPAAGRAPALAHTADALDLLALTKSLYGRRPRAWLVTIPATDLELGEGLSPTAQAGVAAAVAAVRALIDEHVPVARA